MTPETQIERIREIVICPLCPNLFVKNKEQAWCAMDTIGDNQQAIEDFNSGEHESSHWGRKYLILYGLFQALVVQQDATQHLCQVFGYAFKLKDHSELMAIRDVRHACVGHPTERGQHVEHPPHFNSLCRISLSQSGFERLTVNGVGDHTFTRVQINPLIENQRRILNEVIEGLHDYLSTQVKDFKAKFINERLGNLFPPVINFALQQVIEGTVSLSPEIKCKSLVLMTEIEKTTRAVREGLQARGIHLESNYCLLDEEIENAMTHLALFFNGKIANDKTAKSMALELKRKIADLKSYCLEIDEDYHQALEEEDAKAARAAAMATEQERVAEYIAEHDKVMDGLMERLFELANIKHKARRTKVKG